jgi:CxxC motif-containing protein
MTCIICPKGCRLHVTSSEEALLVEGQGCHRGTEYAQSEVLHPMRTVTTTVLYSGRIPRLPVRTDGPVPKDRVKEVIGKAKELVVSPPIVCGQILEENIAGTGTNLIATRTLD